MRRVVTAAEMAAMDREAIEGVGIPGVVLMENAGLGAASIVHQYLAGKSRPRVLIVCGKGNNGGDGYVVARHLRNQGVAVQVFLLGRKGDVRGDAGINLRILENTGQPIQEVKSPDEFNPALPVDVVVDAIFGTGIAGPVRGLAAEIIEKINEMKVPVVSIDLPSGLNADTGAAEGACVRANATATMAEIKRGLLLPPGRDLAGRVHIVDIGSPPDLRSAAEVKTFVVGRADAVRALPRRASDVYKNKVGLIFVLAGSTGMTGAAYLTAFSALRAGSGLVYLGVPRSLNPVLEMKATEVITRPLPEVDSGYLAVEAYAELREWLPSMSAVALGPGIGTHPSTAELAENLVRDLERPLVVDADGLNNLKGKADLLRERRAPTVVTPHPGELSRLCGLSIREISADRIEVAREYAKQWGVVLVLKGSPTVTASPEGTVFINPTGNAGMATGGSGDVLTGIIASLIGQGLDELSAAWLGVYVHGRAGDLASKEHGQMGMVAGDVMAKVPAVLGDLEGRVRERQ